MRAVNVRGHPAVRMADLCDAFEAAGCRNVDTYIASGNVVFDAEDESAIARAVEGVRALVGAPVQVVYRRLPELEAIVAADPFREYLGDRRLKLYVVFLAEEPLLAPALPLVSERDALELIAVLDREAYVVSRPRQRPMYGFPNSFVERALGVQATSRNWSTVVKLVEFARRR